MKVIFFAVLASILLVGCEKEHQISNWSEDANADSSNLFYVSQDDMLYVYDGDTFFIKCRAGLKCQEKNNKLSIRVMGVDTP